MTGCCSAFNFKKICDTFNCKVEQTEKGIRIHLEPKDSSKTKALHDLIKAHKAFFDCDC